MCYNNVKNGIEYLGITNRKEQQELIDYLLISSLENIEWEKEQYVIQEERKEWNDRFKIPRGKTKKFYKDILKDTQKKIDYFKEKINESIKDIEKSFLELVQEDWIEKKRKLKAIIDYSGDDKNFESDIQKAKAYPIENLIEFNTAGFAKCIAHNEKTASMKRYNNKVHCFGCNKSFDSIDIYILINNVSFSEAVNFLKLL